MAQPQLPVEAPPLEAGGPTGNLGGEDLGEEDRNRSKRVYLVTLSHPTQPKSACGVDLKAPGELNHRQILDCVLGSLAATQAARVTPLAFVLMCIFREKHQDGHPHYHIAVKADRCFMFTPLKRCLLQQYGLASHWSCSHDGYATCIAYGHMPSLKKPLADLDPQPLLWAPPGSSHPSLAEACVPPVTAVAVKTYREQKRREQAEKGKVEKFRGVDLWPIVIRENISLGLPGAAEKLIAYARRCGGQAMVEFCFNNFPKLEELIARCWQVEKVEEQILELEKPRLDFVKEALEAPCRCQGRWLPAAMELFAMNDLSVQAWRGAVVMSLEKGRLKGSVVCHAGKEGNEGKSFLLAPLYEVFGQKNVFTSPPKSAFPLLELAKARLVVLDDWRFNEDIVSYPLQLLWFEGKPFIIARPQNLFNGHLRYTKDDPVFITTLEQDILTLKKNILPGDRDMMLKRLKVFRFHVKVDTPDHTIPPCKRCFAHFLLNQDQNREGDSQPRAPRREASGSMEEAPAAKISACDWSVDDVASYVARLGLSHVQESFRSNAVDGRMLTEMTLDDLMQDLGLTRLQARKVMDRLG